MTEVKGDRRLGPERPAGASGPEVGAGGAGRRSRSEGRSGVLEPGLLGVVGLIVVAVTVAGCGGGGPSFGLPDPASSEAEDIATLWRGSVITGLAVGALVWAAIGAAIILYRRRNDDLPSQNAENYRVEVAYTVAPILIVLVLFGFTLVTQREVTALEADPDLRVEVTGYQWSWEFHYPDQGVTVESNGVDRPVLMLPVGSRVHFDLATEDVNHSFWVPRFLVKQDMIAGVDNDIEVEVRDAGVYPGRCAEFCGLKHWSMGFDVEAVPQAEFDSWVSERRAAGPPPELPGADR